MQQDLIGWLHRSGLLPRSIALTLLRGWAAPQLQSTDIALIFRCAVCLSACLLQARQPWTA